MRRLQQRFAQADVQVTDGVKVFLSDDEWLLARPDPDRALFHVTAEAASIERADQLVAEHAILVAELAAGRT
ncbi:MAG: hypothetical protein V9H69_16955 [Anaerolineae bacterium]